MTMLTFKRLIVGGLAAVVVAVAAGIAAFAGLNLGGGGETAEAHNSRSLIGYNIPDRTDVWMNFASISRYVDEGNDNTNTDGDGCQITIPPGTIEIPEASQTVVIPRGTPMTVDTTVETNGCFVRYNVWLNVTSITNDGVTVIAQARTGADVVAHVDDPNARFDGEPHNTHTTSLPTSTGFTCGGRLYTWSEFEPDETRPLFLTAARRSLMGWVWVSAGQQLAQCAAGRIMERLANQ